MINNFVYRGTSSRVGRQILLVFVIFAGIRHNRTVSGDQTNITPQKAFRLLLRPGAWRIPLFHQLATVLPVGENSPLQKMLSAIWNDGMTSSFESLSGF